MFGCSPTPHEFRQHWRNGLLPNVPRVNSFEAKRDVKKKPKTEQLIWWHPSSSRFRKTTLTTPKLQKTPEWSENGGLPPQLVRHLESGVTWRIDQFLPGRSSLLPLQLLHIITSDARAGLPPALSLETAAVVGVTMEAAAARSTS